ncbi:prepilin-type N-terminal cleavage/methylation domain-containing protein [Acidisoma cellulosilytica]|uniref:Prepilin-type N-terminal cleavage/methylation domain-containing protein n=1 Tax=Acidisoma cellulosilyticum TaxID=2802395 RepID=A0A963Z2D9_9PROT|nr:prepilin-type N-terminal cleavage/methylation domain-containing protein [Acidisoma cellulosilyticum]MCB8881479.1 prepilin-type N-terminal cleavage/methylation domain-containing protein [Acidisoma cellulosilyticum]
MTSRTRMAGFTLVEVMVGLALLAMLMTVILSAIRIGTGIWTRAEFQADDLDAMTAVQNLLRRTIESAQPAFASSKPADQSILFAGGPATLRLVAPMPGSNNLGSWTLLTLHLVQDGKDKALTLSWDEAGRSHQDWLLDQVTELDLSYFGAALASTAPQWSKQWARADRLPALIRLHIVRSPAWPVWPDLIAATPVNANATCLSDSAGKDCRRITR